MASYTPGSAKEGSTFVVDSSCNPTVVTTMRRPSRHVVSYVKSRVMRCVYCDRSDKYLVVRDHLCVCFHSSRNVLLGRHAVQHSGDRYRCISVTVTLKIAHGYQAGYHSYVIDTYIRCQAEQNATIEATLLCATGNSPDRRPVASDNGVERLDRPEADTF